MKNANQIYRESFERVLNENCITHCAAFDKEVIVKKVQSIAQQALAEAEKAVVNEDKSQVSDGYHTFAELYEHRHVLYLNLLSRSLKQGFAIHTCLEHYDGWDCITFELDLEKNGQISYHLPISYRRYWQHWGLLEISKEEQELKYDGHTSKDVIQRLLEALKDN